MRRAQMLPLILLLAMPGCALFAGGPPIVTASAAGCSALLPPEWDQGVAPVDLPAGDAVGDWIAGFDGQTGRLDVANDRYRSATGIVRRCEARDAAAVKKAKRGFVARLFSG
jgi:hypothetical protein